MNSAWSNEIEWALQVRDMHSRVNSPIPSETMNALIISALMNRDERVKAERIRNVEKLLSPFTVDIAMSERLPLVMPDADKISGEIKLGNLLQNPDKPVFIKLADIQRGVAVAGSTGCGKTTLTANILLQLPPDVSWLYEDWKRDMRGLCRKHPVKIIRWEWLKLNFFQPPKGVPSDIWINNVVGDLSTHSFHFFSASEFYLVSHLSRLTRNHTDGTYPTPRQVYDEISAIEEHSKRFDEYRAVVRNRLENMLIVWGDRIDYPKAPPLEDILFTGPTVLEVDGLPRDQAVFLSAYILAYEFMRRLYNGQRGSINQVIVNDEATRLFYNRDYAQTNQELGQSFLEQIPQFIRDYKIGLIFCFQEPSQAAHSMLANTNLKIVGSISEGTDLDAICRSLNLDDIERSAITMLEQGEFLVKKPGVRAFTIRGEKIELEKDVTDKELRQRMKPVLDKLLKSGIEQTEQKKDIIELPLTQEATNLLLDINNHPFRGARTRVKELKLSVRRFEIAKQELIREGLVTEENHLKAKFLVLTEKALQVLENQVDTRQWRHLGNLTFEHVLYQVLIRYAYVKLDYEAHIEVKLANGRRLDVLAAKGNYRIGVEVELNPYNELETKLEYLEELSELHIVSNSEEKLRVIKEKLELANGAAIGKVSFSIVSKFLNDLHYIARNSSRNSFLSSNQAKKHRSRHGKGGTENE